MDEVTWNMMMVETTESIDELQEALDQISERASNLIQINLLVAGILAAALTTPGLLSGSPLTLIAAGLLVLAFFAGALLSLLAYLPTDLLTWRKQADSLSEYARRGPEAHPEWLQSQMDDAMNYYRALRQRAESKNRRYRAAAFFLLICVLGLAVATMSFLASVIGPALN